MAAMTGQVIGQSDARAEALAVVVGFLLHQTGCQRAERRDCLELLERAAVGDVRSANKVKVFVPAQAKIQRQAIVKFPVILEIEPKLLGVLDDERGVAYGNTH